MRWDRRRRTKRPSIDMEAITIPKRQGRTSTPSYTIGLPDPPVSSVQNYPSERFAGRHPSGAKRVKVGTCE